MSDTTETKETTEQADDISTIDGLGDRGKEAIKKEREARKAAESAKALADAELATLRQKALDEQAAKAQADEEAAEKKGEFERLANERAEKIKTVSQENESLKAENEIYKARDRKRIEDGIKDIPEDLKGFDPGVDAPLDQRMRWFDLAHAEAVKRGDPKNVTKFPKTPRPEETGPENDEEARRAQARNYRDF